ncbi:MAG: glycine zipper family protein [Ignavibacteria bacterium]|nr:glycine zipper family protein [Ignavibacteria bacterium]MBT8383759.1 glycine zipper family protein [Ignavibacteria bacterium]MBT8392544.1 glycine zipper family protein [Ignavibacteria bacterium]NNJ52356.1 hypothetical protein [Ignavibacteriaceae bacterium]NNL20473.1 hypothetical protein [Ignavibacteriaceae bacterium]
MKVIIYAILNLTIFSSSLFSQDKDSLIQLYPGLGDTIDQFDRNYFELFQNIDGFNSAVFYTRNNEQVISKVSYLKNEELKDTVIAQPLSKLESIRTMVELIDWQSNKRVEYAEEFVLVTKDSSIYEAELVMFSRSHLYFDSDINYITDDYLNWKFKVPIESVENLSLAGSTAWSSAGWGAGIGLLLGTGAAGAVSGGSSNIVSSSAVGGASMILFGLVGGVIGLVLGIASESEDTVFNINSQEDLIQLKKYAKYYYQYDQSVEDEYVELN